MVTRSKSGIHKRKVFLSTKYPLFIPSNAYFDTTEPTTYKEAAASSVWREAMEKEISALQQKGTWSLVSPPSDKHVVGYKWVYKIKHHPDSSVARYKARPVAKGYH